MDDLKGFEILLPLLNVMSEEALIHFNLFFDEYEELCEKIAANDKETIALLTERGVFDSETEN